MEDIISSTDATDMQKMFDTAILHTALGDIHVSLFGKDVPRTVENFRGHAKDDYYNSHLFHPVIKSFMIQTGELTGTGGGSIWGSDFEDTTGSQFLITSTPTPSPDNKHTVFGGIMKANALALQNEEQASKCADDSQNNIPRRFPV